MTDVPDLVLSLGDIPNINQTNSIYDLKRFLYANGSNHRSNDSLYMISRGELGEPRLDRLDILIAVKEELEARVIMGRSPHSTRTYLSVITHFFRFLENNDLSFEMAATEENVLIYSEDLFNRSKLANPTLSEKSAYNKVEILSSIFGSILEIPEPLRLSSRARLRKRRKSNKAISNKLEKQNLHDTFRLGKFLTDLILGLTPQSIFGALPLVIAIRPGVVEGDQIKLTAGLSKNENSSRSSSDARKFSQRRLKPAASMDIKLHKRWQLVNLRIDAEFMMFIAQTGMNVAQAKLLTRNTFKFKPLGESWLVRVYKNRKGGEVRFNVYNEYKPFLKNYLQFLNKFFPDTDQLFPKFDKSGNVSECYSRVGSFTTLRNLVFANNIEWVTPRVLRNSRINWLLRRSGDYDLTASIAQHTQRTLRENYERMSQQRAMIEVTNFWNKHDPITRKDLKVSLVGSLCNGLPDALESIPSAVARPNCVNSSGCLWCRHSRDVDTLDYVWSLASFRHLKCLEASLTKTKHTIPADVVIDRITMKIRWFQESSEERKQWVKEAENRVSEGHFHDNWSALIEFME